MKKSGGTGVNNKALGGSAQRSVSQVGLEHSRNPLFHLLMLVLSIYVLVTLSIESFLISDPEIRRVIQRIDLIICLIFLADFLYLFFTASDTKRYMRWGWIDLASSIPMVDALRWGRVARVVRIVQVLRAVKSIHVVYQHVKSSPFETLTIMTCLVVFFSFSIGATLILDFERGHDSELTSASDALWWSLLSILNAKVSMASPVSSAGIITGVFLNKIGILLFAYINGMIISWVVRNRDNEAVLGDTE